MAGPRAVLGDDGERLNHIPSGVGRPGAKRAWELKKKKPGGHPTWLFFFNPRLPTPKGEAADPGYLPVLPT